MTRIALLTSSLAALLSNSLAPVKQALAGDGPEA
jgi:hypothetical protein